MSLNPAEFRTLREGLGLSEKDVSMLTLVPEAQLKVWENGAADIPDGVAGLILDIDREIAARLARALEKAAGREAVTLIRFKNALDFKKAGPDMAPIPAMMAFKCHGALIGRLYRALGRMGVAVSLKYWRADS